MQVRPRLLLATTGGTIASAPSAGGLDASKGAQALLAATPEVSRLADVETVDVCQVLSHAMTPSLMCALAHEIDRRVSSGIAGVVITHGTDTMEETAYALALQLRRSVPIVLTGAMRAAGTPGADGAANLIGAFRVALDPKAAPLGPLVVMQDEIHLARWVTKVHTSRVAGFASPEFGPAGALVEDRVCLHVRTAENEFLGLPQRLDQRVEIIFVAAGMDGALVDGACKYADGLVVAGTGGGHVPPEMARALRTCARSGLPIVLASRTASGPLLNGTYGGAGSEADLRALGVIPAHSLSPVKARLRLMVALALRIDPQAAFPRCGGRPLTEMK